MSLLIEFLQIILLLVISLPIILCWVNIVRGDFGKPPLIELSTIKKKFKKD